MTSPFTPKAWADLQAGGTAITAAELNRMETGIGLGLADRPGGYQPDGSRRAAFMFGCGGEGTQTGFNSGHARMPFRIPVGTKRWRVLFHNANPTGTSTGAPTVNVNGVWLGENFRNLDTGDPISWWAGTPVQAVSAFTLSAGTPYRSPWVTASNLQLVAGRTHMISYGWTKTSGTIYTGSGGSWTTTAAADVTAAQPAATYNAWVPFHVAIEYEFVGNQRVIVAVGDSITEGAKHVWSMWGWPQVLSMRLGAPVVLSAQFGSFAGTIAPGWNGANASTEPRYTRIKDGGLNIDDAIVYLGTNETAWGGTLLQMQQGVAGVTNRIRSEWGVRDVFWCTLHPRNMLSTDAGEILRVQINDWLRGQQPNVNGVFDFARVVESAFNGVNLQSYFEGSGADRTHPGPRGQARFADAISIGDG